MCVWRSVIIEGNIKDTFFFKIFSWNQWVFQPFEYSDFLLLILRLLLRAHDIFHHSQISTKVMKNKPIALSTHEKEMQIKFKKNYPVNWYECRYINLLLLNSMRYACSSSNCNRSTLVVCDAFTFQFFFTFSQHLLVVDVYLFDSSCSCNDNGGSSFRRF